MITDERIVSYIRSLERPSIPILSELEVFAHENNVPIIRKEMESFLKTMIAINKPHRILELGTAIGYSAILMSQGLDDGDRIDTIENYPIRIEQAKNNIERAGKGNIINLIAGDALEVLKELKGTYDMVFMDAAKAQYINYLPYVTRLLRCGGILITDNVLQEGDLIESRFVIERRDRTIHNRMREYLYTIKNSKEYETTIIPIGDGITLSVKTNEQ